MTTGWPSDVVPRLRGRVRRVVNSSDVFEFYIGRTAHPGPRKSQHGADDLLPLYETTSINNSKRVEQALLGSFRDHFKCSNEAMDARGGVSEGRWHCVYLAIWRG